MITNLNVPYAFSHLKYSSLELSSIRSLKDTKFWYYMQPYFDNKVIKSLQKMKSRKKIQICRSLNITTKQPTLNLFGKAKYSYIPMQNFK